MEHGSRNSLPKVEGVHGNLANGYGSSQRYFKDHPITVLTDKPVEWAFLKPDRSQRMVKWAIELEEYDIEYGIEGLFEGQTDEPAEVGK
ncbi:hypothetical protein CTI12_AA014330 [Artemisia annua]|uniref:Uncharacterized protein n=1 Tax=Artemisia annua TaxID=35608 RepID=A0A2U1QLH5_ARTAN|nr:hypothetical protein CTI12_AA014330 [Artemisia annua]